MISSIESFSMISNCSGRLARNIFIRMGGFAGALDLKIDGVANVIEKGFGTGVYVSFSG